MNITPIKTEHDYKKALERVDNLINADLGTIEGDELDILSILIERYEEEKFPILPPTPIAAIRFRMEQLGMKQADFAILVGENRASEILSGRRTISISLLKIIHKELGIPYENLLDDEQPIQKNISY